MTITDKRTFDAIDNLRAWVAGDTEELKQEMNDDIEELIAAVTNAVAKRLRRNT